MRAAIYFTPPAGAELTRLAGRWLGRDAFSGEPTRGADAALDALTAEPARYGFHATLKAPFRLAPDRDLAELDRRLAAFAGARPPVPIRRLALARLGSFFALVPDRDEPDIAALEEAVVTGFDGFRAPMSEAEAQRRRPDRLTERQRRHLADWGYPHVLDEFRFHMTLTGPVEGGAEALAGDIEARFAPVLGRPLAVDGLAIFVEPRAGEPFRVFSHHRLGARRTNSGPKS